MEGYSPNGNDELEALVSDNVTYVRLCCGNRTTWACNVEFLSKSSYQMTSYIVPIINIERDRKKSIIENTPAIFEIIDNPYADASKPIVELDSQSEVNRWCGLIIQSAKRYGVDPRLAMAIMYMETTHGWYDKFYPDFLERQLPMRRSILPMNIHYRYWKSIGVTKELVSCPY